MFLFNDDLRNICQIIDISPSLIDVKVYRFSLLTKSNQNYLHSSCQTKLDLLYAGISCELKRVFVP